MVNFTCYNPVKVVFGAGESARTGKIVKNLGKTCLVVCYEQHDFLDSLLNSICSSLEREGIRVLTHYTVTANPLLSPIHAGIEICRAEKVDFVVGVGGGSVMDSAKTIAVGACYEGDVWDMFMSRHDSSVRIVTPKAALPAVMIPTLPATSSEMNNIAVVTNDKTTEKSYLQSDLIYSRISIMDPKITCSLPAYQTACGAVDAISHIMEAYFNCAPDTPLQDRLQEADVATIMDLSKKVLADPKNVALRSSIMWASTLAWNGWLQCGIAPGSPMHQIGHVLSARFGVTHGATLGIIMPAFFRYVAPQRADRFVRLGEKMLGLDLSNMTELEGAYRAIDAFEEYIASVGVQTKLSQVNIPESAFEDIANDVVRISCDANGNLPSNPPVGKEGILAVLKLAL